ncbi:NAD(P)H-binding protein [Enterovibrio calviensis]|uniref:NAD(P)H-binding protein n=1 Tax=Enterovibrio calviensis TaxID=91359 RepID=UPI00048181DD|nr:NAD(P)H-binding protein [Enterovibrio calviensis]
MTTLSIVLAGATGLIGHSILQQALKDLSIDKVSVLTRKNLDIEHEKLTQWVSIDLSLIESDQQLPPPAIGIIALGTTLKKAGTKEKLHDIDVVLVVNTARRMKDLGVQHIVVVSCYGASTNAKSHYLRCKGEMEDKVEALKFARTTFLQPGPLTGTRDESRQDEAILQFVLRGLTPLMKGRFSNYIPIHANTVAQAALGVIHTPIQYDVERLSSTSINLLAKTYGDNVDSAFP